MIFRSLFLFLTVLCVAAPDVRACTVWGAAGNRVKGGGVIIAKNRDNSPGLTTVLKLLRPEKGYRVFALVDTEAEGYIVGGINEKGLVVLNAAASSVSREKRLIATEDFSERLLTTFDSVEAALSRPELFSASYPALYMLADSTKIVTIEIAPGGNVATHAVANGTVAFTNHYVDKKVSLANERISANSKFRVDRIRHLLASRHSPMTKSDFIAMSADRRGGPDRAIWRTGAAPGKVRTLASMIISLPKRGQPEIFVKLAAPGGIKKTYRITSDAVFPSESAE